MTPSASRQPQPRRHRGTPTGGQFAGKTNPESDLELSSDAEWKAARRQRLAKREAAQEAAGLTTDEVAPMLGRAGGVEGVIALLEARRNGVEVRTATKYMSYVAGKHENDDDRGMPPTKRRNHAARKVWEERCGEMCQQLRRTLTLDEEDRLADEVRDETRPNDRPTKDFHRPPTFGVFAVDPETSATTLRAAGDARHRTVDALDGMKEVPRRQQELGIIVHVVYRVPKLKPAKLSDRHSRAFRAKIQAAGGVRALALEWDGDPDSPLFAPYTAPTPDQREGLVRALTAATSDTAESLWCHALTGATLRR